MLTQCNQESLQFHPLVRRAVRGQFDGGTITTDAGGLLLREVEKRTGIVAQFAGCFRDHRDPARIEHRVEAGSAELCTAAHYSAALSGDDRQPSCYLPILIVTISNIQTVFTLTIRRA